MDHQIEIYNKIIDLHQQGYDAPQIARAVGLSHDQILLIIERLPNVYHTQQGVSS